MIPQLDVPMAAIVVSLAVLCGGIAGGAPALGFSGTASADRLRAGERGRVGGRRQRLLHRGLVGVEIAFAVILLIGSALMVRTFIELRSTDVGFNTERLLTLRLPLPWTYPAAQQVAFFDEAMRQIRALPGVLDVAYSSDLALAQVAQGERLTAAIDGQSARDAAGNPVVTVQRVSSGFFSTMQIPLLQGRTFSDSDDERGQRVAVINNMLAKRLWPGQNPIGRRIGAPTGTEPLVVAGVVGDVRHERASGEVGLDLYVSSRQFPSGWNHVVVRSTVSPMSLVDPIQRIVTSLDANQPVYDFKTMAQRLEDTEWTRRIVAAILASGAVVALLLSAVGVYGVVAYIVSRRTREFGVRMALGATHEAVLQSVLRDGVAMAVPGIAAGIVATALGARMLTELLYGVATFDPLSFMAVPLLLIAVVLAASWIPARRATRVSPTTALRAE
jgi:putative ABC transport system permease protein